MSQWGSEALAQQGYSCTNILKYYYGDDISLPYADLVQGLPVSYPGAAMRLGDCSEAIKQMQEMLNIIRSAYPAIPEITQPNGYFDDETQAAVRKFQEVFGLTVDGVVGKETWYKISQVFVGVAGLLKSAVLNPNDPDVNSSITVQSSAVNPGTTKPTLKLGDTGAAVKEVQEDMAEIHFYDGAIDGYFGTELETAVKMYQKAKGIKVDGIVGPITWGYILGRIEPHAGCISPTPPTPSTCPSGSNSYTVKSGDTLYLLAERYNTTVSAIMEASGITSTALSIGQILCIPGAPAPSPTPTTCPSGSTAYTVKSGDSLWALAQRFGTTVAAIKAASGITSDSLSIGQILCIPGSSSGYFEYTVKSGDTLYFLAERYHTTVSAIMTLNGLTSTALSIGQVLKIPSNTTASQTASTKTTTVANSPTPSSSATSPTHSSSATSPTPTSSKVYTVRSGDSLWHIAQKYGTTVDKLVSLNHLTMTHLSIGQKLIVV